MIRQAVRSPRASWPKRFPLWLWFGLMLGWMGIATHARAADDFLDPEVAFKLSARVVDERNLELLFSASPGYYLYREQFKFSADGTELDPPALPPGEVKFDETFQKTVETYRGDVRIVVPVRRAPSSFRLLVSNQGCADKGLCYPPTQRAVEVALRAFGGDGSIRVLTAAQTLALDASSALPGKEANIGGASPFSVDDGVGLKGVLSSGRFWSVVGVFFVAGLLLSLTPCMLPMLPILSSIIVGQGQQASRGRGLGLAISYSIGMAMVYTALGIAAGLAGEGLAAALQNRWVLTIFAAGLVALSLSMFGVYEFRPPGALNDRLTVASQRLTGGRIASVFAMGGVSALIVSPCVAAPLAGAMMYLSQTRDVWLGGTALFSLAAGMSVPLILIGASAGALLPRAGRWMEEVKHFFGLVLLGVALWTVESLLPGSLALALWGTLAISAAVLCIGQAPAKSLGRFSSRLLRRSIAAVLAAFGLLQLAGAASGGNDPLQPLAHLFPHRPDAGSQSTSALAFRPVRSVAQLDEALRGTDRPVVLDFYADWCVSCREMERSTLTDSAVQTRLANALLLRVDVTANNADDRQLLRRFQLFGPPGTIFFDHHGRELTEVRVIGYQNSEQFIRTLGRAGI